jgi:hypothetical protein
LSVATLRDACRAHELVAIDGGRVVERWPINACGRVR